jgi:hypothetical protein
MDIEHAEPSEASHLWREKRSFLASLGTTKKEGARGDKIGIALIDKIRGHGLIKKGKGVDPLPFRICLEPKLLSQELEDKLG